MEYIPYNTLIQDTRSYEIMLLRDLHDYTFLNIAHEYGMSVGRARQIYSRIKIKQIRLYINQISLALGHENILQIRKVFDNAYDCYQNYQYASAYLEQRYEDILTDYREGEPGIPKSLIESLPPFEPNLSEKTVARVIEMREAEKASYATIGRTLNMTPDKAKYTYEMFYHTKSMELLKDLENQLNSNEEKITFYHYYFSKYKTSKKLYEYLIEEINKER